METFWRNQNAFVAIKSNHVAGSLKDCGAMTALGKMLIDCCSLNKTEISVDIIRDISPDFFAAYSHGFLTSFETHPSRPSCASPGPGRPSASNGRGEAGSSPLPAISPGWPTSRQCSAREYRAVRMPPGSAAPANLRP